jgi:hypothetical protein
MKIKDFKTMVKKILLLIGIFIVAGVGIQKITSMASTRTETQPYKVVHIERGFEIRFYPATTMAVITSKATTYKELAGPGFKKLAGYIFGGNEAKKSISMTSPVHMDINDSVSTMSFVMPSEYTLGNLPQPTDKAITLKTTKDEYVAVVKFGGYASDKDIKKYSTALESALNASHIAYSGNFRFLGYNAPYQFFGRRNEIIVHVVWPQ